LPAASGPYRIPFTILPPPTPTTPTTPAPVFPPGLPGLGQLGGRWTRQAGRGCCGTRAVAEPRHGRGRASARRRWYFPPCHAACCCAAFIYRRAWRSTVSIPPCGTRHPDVLLFWYRQRAGGTIMVFWRGGFLSLPFWTSRAFAPLNAAPRVRAATTFPAPALPAHAAPRCLPQLQHTIHDRCGGRRSSARRAFPTLPGHTSTTFRHAWFHIFTLWVEGPGRTF